jgi:DNA polymerase/3'-5' exonuclease PolX
VHTGKLFGKRIFQSIKTLTHYVILNNRVVASNTESMKIGFNVNIREN